MEAELFHVEEGSTDMKLTGALRNSAKEPSKPNVSMRDSGSQVCNSKRIPYSGILYHKLRKGFTDVSGKCVVSIFTAQNSST